MVGDLSSHKNTIFLRNTLDYLQSAQTFWKIVKTESLEMVFDLKTGSK